MNIKSFSPVYNYKSIVIPQKMQYSTNIPVQKNVTFTGRAVMDPKSLMAIMPSAYLCDKAEKAATPAQKYLDTFIGESIKAISESVRLENGVVVPSVEYSSNVKSAQSIREKVISKYAKISRNEDEEFKQQVTNLMMSKFTFKKNVNRNVVYQAVDSAVTKRQADEMPPIPPYKHAYVFLDAILDKFLNDELFDTSIDGVISNAERKMQDILKEIENTPRPDKEENYSHGAYINPKTMTGVKHYANDIARCRIIMNVPEKNSTDKVLDELEKLVRSGKLKIKSIENYIPKQEKLPAGDKIYKYLYTNESKIQELADIAGADYRNTPSPSGYMGIHINVDLTNSVFGPKNDILNGFQGEIQILGRDVMQLKDIEDLCYKLKDNKSSIGDMYKPFKEYFLKYYTPKCRAAFDDYTYALYLYQRALPPHSNKMKFPPIKYFDKTGRIPPELDFNKLKARKELCEATYAACERIRNSD